MNWIDAHVHIGHDSEGINADANNVEQLFENGYLDKAVVFCFDEDDGLQAGNERIASVVREDGADRLTGLFRVDPRIHNPEDLEDIDTDVFAGFKLHPRSQDFSMQRVYHHLEVMGDMDVPALVHTGVGDSLKRRAHPEEVLEAARVHPDTDIILAHGTKGYYFHAPDEFVEGMQTLDNVYVDTSLHMTPLGIETLVEDMGAEQVLFASDYPYGHPVPMQKNVEFADIDKKAAEQVAWRNAEQLFF